MIALVCLFLATAVSAQRPQTTGTAHLRVSDTEKFFYSGLDHRIVGGWSDDRSVNVHFQYGVVLPPAQNLAQLNFSNANAAWRIEARDQQGYLAKEEDEIIFRVRAGADGPNVPLVFFAGPAEDNEPVRHNFIASNSQWHLVHVPLTALQNPIQLRAVGLRSELQGRATVYVAYMYLKINPALPKDPKKKN